jgi:flagellar biosynthetic protein FlhB
MVHINKVWINFLILITPLFIVTTFIAVFTTFSQTNMNFSWKAMAPSIERFNILKGLARMVNSHALMEMVKGIGKMTAVGVVSYLILKSEWFVTPGLINLGIEESWAYWGEITKSLFWAVAGLLLLIAGADYMYNFITLENRMKMTKKEVKDEFKKREVDPHVKARMRRMQRDLSNRKMIEKTKTATVVITNPTHYAVALKYEIGMSAPVIVAKGVDFLALRMREVAKKQDIPIVENKPLARTLYKVLEVGQEIPESLYKAISEVIRYVFKTKGIKYGQAS